MSKEEFNYEEGGECPIEGCDGIMEYGEVDDCSCHLCAPCHWHENQHLCCSECGEEEIVSYPGGRQELDRHFVTPAKGERKLDNTKVDFICKPHSGFSMIKEGVYPNNMDWSQVEAVVKGTFGGRFASFGNGKFKYIAYTD